MPPPEDETATEDPRAAPPGGETAESALRDAGAETDIHLRQDFLHELLDAIHREDADTAKSLVVPLHSADVADLFEVLASEERRMLAGLVGDTLDPAFLSELSGAAFEDVTAVLPPRVIADAVRRLETDDAVYVLEDLDEEAQREVLKTLAREERLALEEGLAFPEDSAGRLMQRDLVAVPEFWTVGQTIDFLRAQGEEEVPADFYEVIVVDPTYRPVGSVPLSRLLCRKRPTRVREIMNPKPHLVHVAVDQEEVARQFAKYHLISAAVVNDFGRLVGVITVDDVVGVIEEEAEEDILALAGVRAGDLNEPIHHIARSRLLWLVISLGTALLAASVIGQFTDSIEKIVALAVLMPVVASMGGNAGNQAMAVAVRSLATRELGRANAPRVIRKELLVALLNGLLLALLVAIVAQVWFGEAMLSVVLGMAMVINMLAAGLGGILVPLALEKLGIDPAVASSVFVTTLTDVVGFLAFLGLGTLILL